jgi:hypothetical protein
MFLLPRTQVGPVPDMETKAPKFRYRSLLSEQNQNVLIWSTYFRNESITLKSVPKLLKIKSKRLGDFLKFKNETRTKPSLVIIGLKRFHKPRLQRKQNRTFLFLKNYIKANSKRFKLGQNFLRQSKTFSCGRKLSSTDRKRFVLIQNFVSKTNIFDLFWNKSSKTKAFDLERTLV